MKTTGLRPAPTQERTEITVSIQRAFAELDSYFAERHPAYHYDVAAGLARLKRSLRLPPAAADSPERLLADIRQRICAHVDREMHGVIAEYLGALQIGQYRITSPHTSLFAGRLADDDLGERWAVSWLPGRAFGRDQALCAMILDEIVIAHDLDSTTMLRAMGQLALVIGIPLPQVLHRLSMAKIMYCAPWVMMPQDRQYRCRLGDFPT